MKKGSIIRMTLLAIILAGSLLVLQSSGISGNSGCEETNKCCCKTKDQNSSPGGIIWESLPRQFFSFINTNY